MTDDLQITPDFSAGLVRVRPGMNVCRRYRVTADVDDLVVDIDVETQDDGSTRCLGVSARVPDDDMSHPGVSSVGLRQIPVRKLIAQARRSSLIVFDDDFASVGDDSSSGALDDLRAQRMALEASLARSRTQIAQIEDTFGIRKTKPGKGRPLSDDHLQRVARAYQAAVDAGDHPVGSIARIAQVARPTASGWVVEARRRGLLAPA
jgi:hypothetical protein